MERDNAELNPRTTENIASSEGPATPDRFGTQGPASGGEMLGAPGAAPTPGVTGHTAPIGAPTDEDDYGSAGGGTHPGETGNPTFPDRSSSLGTPGNAGRGAGTNLEPGTPGVPGSPVPDAFGADPTPPSINGVRSGEAGAHQTMAGTNAGVATGGIVGPTDATGQSGFHGATGTMNPAVPEESNTSQSSLGANEDQIDRDDVTSEVSDMGLDALGRDEPDDPDYGRGEPSPEEGFARPDDEATDWTRRDTDVPGYGRTGTPGLGGARPPQPDPDGDESFEDRSREMQAPPDAGRTDGAGGPGYDSAGSNTNDQSALVGGGAASGIAGSGPIGGSPGRGDTPDAAARRRIEHMPAPSAYPQPAIGVETPTDNTVPNPPPPAISSNRTPSTTPEENQRGAISSYDGEVGGAGSGSSTSGGGGSMASRAAQDNRESGQSGDDERDIHYGSSGRMGLGGAEPPRPAPEYIGDSNQNDPDLEGRDPVDEELFRPMGSHGPGADTPLGPPPGSGIAGDASGPDVFASDSGPIDAPADSGIVTAGDLRREWEEGQPLPVRNEPSPVQDDIASHGNSGGLGGGAWAGGVEGQDAMLSSGSGRRDDALRRAEQWSRNDVSAGPEPDLPPEGADDLGSANTAANASSLNSDLDDASSPSLGPGNPNIPRRDADADDEDALNAAHDPTRSGDLTPGAGDLVLDEGTRLDAGAADPTQPSDDVTGPGANI